LPTHRDSFGAKEQRVWIVTARHNLTGKDNFTDAWLGQALQPRHVKVFPAFMRDNNVMEMGAAFGSQIVEDDGTPTWFEDPSFASLRTDIACIDVPKSPETDKIVCLNDEKFQEIGTDPGDQCFVLGYPSQSYFKPYAPVWRRATIAMDVVVTVDDKPMFLLDCATSKAMSGSPVLRRERSISRTEGGQTSFFTDPIWNNQFVGVYGGRISAAESGERDALGEIAYAYYGNRIEAIVSAAQIT
jgi:hypothetical protein